MFIFWKYVKYVHQFFRLQTFFFFLEVADSTLMDALQPKSFLLSLAVIIHLLDREVIPRSSAVGSMKPPFPWKE